MSVINDFHGHGQTFPELSAGKFKKNHNYAILDAEEGWKPKLIEDLTDMRRCRNIIRDDRNNQQCEITITKIIKMIDEICTN